MNISKNKAINCGMYLILILNIYIYLISNKQFGNITILKYGIILIGIGYFFMFYRINKCSVKNNIGLIAILMIIQFFFLPLSIFLIQGITETIGYSFISLICILFYICIAYFLKDEERFEKFVKIFYLMTLIYIIIAIVNNPPVVNIMDIKNNLFNIDGRMNREMYGFVAPNAFAILSITNILLSFYLSITTYKKQVFKKFFMYITIVFNIIFIVTTASRGALISLIVFFLVFFYNKIVIKRTNKIVNYIITLGISIYIINIISNFFSLGLNYSKLSSGRIGNWIEVIQRLNEKKSMFMGLGYVNSNTFYNSDITANLLTDNWFIHTLATQGYLGFILGIILIVVILITIYKVEIKKYSDTNNYIKSFMMLILVYSSIENMFFNVNYILTMLYWITIFTYLFRSIDFINYKGRMKNE